RLAPGAHPGRRRPPARRPRAPGRRTGRHAPARASGGPSAPARPVGDRRLLRRAGGHGGGLPGRLARNRRPRLRRRGRAVRLRPGEGPDRQGRRQTPPARLRGGGGRRPRSAGRGRGRLRPRGRGDRHRGGGNRLRDRAGRGGSPPPALPPGRGGGLRPGGDPSGARRPGRPPDPAQDQQRQAGAREHPAAVPGRRLRSLARPDVTETGWAATGLGEWRCSDALVTGAVTPYLRPLFIAGLDAGSRTAFRRYGLPLAGFDFSVVAVPIKKQARPVVPAVGPAFLARFGPLVRCLFALHPELRRRSRRAAEALARQEWRAEVELWRRELADELRSANLALQEVDPRSLDDAELADHVARATRLLRRGTEIHFQQGVAWSYPVGDWLRRTCAWTGASPASALAVLKGSSPATTAPREPLRLLALAIAEVPAARAALGDPAGGDGPGEHLAALRASSPRVARALDDYLGEHGDRLVTGYDLADRTLRELPWVVVRSIARHLAAAPETAQAASSPTPAESLRDAVPAAFRGAWDQSFQEAAVAYGFREEEVGATYLWPAGLLRRALLAVGERCAARGGLAAPEHVLETEPEEIAPLLLGEGHAPSAAALAERARERLRLSALPVPAVLGEPGPEPPLDSLPAACAALLAGVSFYLSLTDARGEPPPDGAVLRGQGVGGGRYEGRARLALTPADFDRVEAGDVLVARTTSPAFNVLLPIVGAVVTDRGGLLCHTAIVAREFGLPAVVGTGDATARIPDGARLLVDGDLGLVEVRSALPAGVAA